MRLTVRRTALALFTVTAALVAGACAPPAPAEPQSTAALDCQAVPGRICTTGVLQSQVGPTGAQGAVTLDDAGALAGTLSASVQQANFSCLEFEPIGSEQLQFDFVQSNSVDPSGLTKTAVLSEQVTTELPADQFNVCFSSVNNFPALLPSQYDADLLAGDFSGNTVQVANDGQPDEFIGQLLPCSLGFGVPCILNRTLTPTAPGSLVQRLEVTVRAPVGDPKLRF